MGSGKFSLKKRLALAIGASAMLLAFFGGGVGAQGNDEEDKYLAFKPVIDPAAYAQAKAQSRARAAERTTPAMTTVSPHIPSVMTTFPGVDMLNPLTNLTPSDSTGAIGVTEYIEIINKKIGVYNRSGALLSANTLNGLTGLGATDRLFDPQMIWDAETNRFYYVMADARGSFTNTHIAWGYSKTDSPFANSADWCHYQSDLGVYGTRAFPDAPKLGDSRYFLLIGVNRFRSDLTVYLGSDLVWITKPSAGKIATCPAPGKSGVKQTLTNANGSLMTSPVPANQIDTSSTGWVLGVQDATATVPGSFITLYRVGRSGTTGAATFTRFTVALPAALQFFIPPNAPQAGTNYLLDTMDGRLTQAVATTDPRVGRLAIWAQHTVAGGAGSQVNWFEIDPGTSTSPPRLYQYGQVSHPSLYVYNGAISSDRIYRVTSSGSIVRKFGSNMVLGFNTSSTTTNVAIQMVSKIGANAPSGFMMVKQSPGKMEDFSCTPCRWGDYAGATPDPAAPTASPATAGRIWLTSMWNSASADPTNIDWSTWNWAVSP